MARLRKALFGIYPLFDAELNLSTGEIVGVPAPLISVNCNLT